MPRLKAVFMLFTCFTAQRLAAATISGTVTDASGNRIKDVRVDHIGKVVVVPQPDLKLEPAPDEIRTDDLGHFQVATAASGIVLRKPGYISQRLLVAGDAQVEISMQQIAGRSQCKQLDHLIVKTKDASDADYTATVYYIETKAGSPGILSGHGSVYSLGAPSDSYVWNSKEYAEMMYETGMIDAWGQSKDGKYWRARSVFGASARYDGVNRETAEQLDCVMEAKKLP